MQSHLELCKQKIKETKVCANGFGWRSSGAVCKALVASIHRPTIPYIDVDTLLDITRGLKLDLNSNWTEHLLCDNVNIQCIVFRHHRQVDELVSKEMSLSVPAFTSEADVGPLSFE